MFLRIALYFESKWSGVRTPFPAVVGRPRNQELLAGPLSRPNRRGSQFSSLGRRRLPVSSPADAPVSSPANAPVAQQHLCLFISA